MKIIVTGASGFLGREVCLAALRRGHEVLALGGSRAPVVPGVAQARAFDLCAEAALEALVLEEFPHAVVHCAAFPTIEACQADPARAQVLNGKCWTPPSFSKGRLYLRGRTESVCLDVAAK
jgi:dTDP-4-dehydrorhamnose reductase